MEQNAADTAALSAIEEAFEQADAPQENTPSAAQVEQTPTEGTPAPPSESDSFTQKIDPNTLPPELQAIYKSMQGDYTRKMQEVSELRKLGDPSEISQYVSFVRNLQTNQDFARNVYNELGQLLGVSAADAAQMVAQSQAANDTDDFPFADDSTPDVNSQLVSELNQLRQWAASVEEERVTSRLEAELTRQESMIRQQNPNYSDQDMEAIYQLAFSHNGDLLAAEQAYTDLQSRWAQSYLSQKSTVPAAMNQPSSATPTAEPPVDKFTGLDDPRLEELVNRYIAANLE